MTETTEKKGFMARMRKPKVEEVTEARQETRVSKKDSTRRMASVTREGVPVISASSGGKFNISSVRGVEPKITQSNKEGGVFTRRVKREMVVLSEAPTARDSAFSGPPRYDWIDIVSALFDSEVVNNTVELIDLNAAFNLNPKNVGGLYTTSS
jgi:hypothetical protein